VGGLRQYAIPFRGLKEGKHHYEFVADNSFFEQFDLSEVKKGLVKIGVELIKHSQFLELHFSLNGKVRVQCDRCLKPFAIGIQHQAVLYVRFGEKTHEQSEEVLILADSVSEVRLEQYIYEYIHLALPYQRIHPEIDGNSGCDPEMVRKLEAHTIQGRSNSEDPRWDKLKGLINNTE
jgi:uncharacterized metal-binding protein YceD (DUF177 family)